MSSTNSIESYRRLLASLNQDRDASKALLARFESEISSIQRSISDGFDLAPAHLGDELMYRMIMQKQRRSEDQLKVLHLRRDDLRKKIARDEKRLEFVELRLKSMIQAEERKEQEIFISERVAILAAQASGKHASPK